MSSGTLPTAVAMTGSPAAAASRIALGIPSLWLGCTKQSLCSKSRAFASPLTGPANVTTSCKAASRTRRSHAARCPGAAGPATTSWKRTPTRRSRPAASSRSPSPLASVSGARYRKRQLRPASGLAGRRTTAGTSTAFETASSRARPACGRSHVRQRGDSTITASAASSARRMSRRRHGPLPSQKRANRPPRMCSTTARRSSFAAARSSTLR